MAPGKLTGRGAVPSSIGKSDANPHPNHQRGIGGMDPSVYLSVCRRDSGFAPEACSPLFKVNTSSPGETPCRIAELKTDVGGKTFVSLPSGWIIGVGGDPGSTIIIDTTKTPTKVVRGPDLLAAKWCPVIAAVGNKVYALCKCPSYKTQPNFAPWFEVLDLSKATETADGSLCLDGCSWEELPWPLCFPRRLTPTDYHHPPIISVRSCVVVLPYILISLNQEFISCTYAFDTSSGEWHKIEGKSLPFVGAATPHGDLFLGSSLDKGSVNAYLIRVSSTNTVAGVSGKGTSLRLSIHVCLIRNKAHERVGGFMAEQQHIISLDRGRFSLLTFSLDNPQYISSFDSEDDETYSTQLRIKLTTYHIHNPALLETQNQEQLLPGKHEIKVSKHRKHNFEFYSSYGFSYPPIPFALSI